MSWRNDQNVTDVHYKLDFEVVRDAVNINRMRASIAMGTRTCQNTLWTSFLPQRKIKYTVSVNMEHL